LGSLLRTNSPSATWRLACFLCAAIQVLGGVLAWALQGMAQGSP